MSTKIYNAVRISKKLDIKTIIDKMRQIAEEVVANDYNFLYMIHAITSAMAHDEKDANKIAASVYEDVMKNDFNFTTLTWMIDKVKKAELSLSINDLDCSMIGVVGYDEDYWYIKFFCNSGIARKIYNEIEKIEGVEDFHYQNQTDPPDDISYEDFEKRSKKWDELIPNDKFNSLPFEVNIFDYDKLERLIRKYYWTGEKDVYKHLAYKFDKNYQDEFKKK